MNLIIKVFRKFQLIYLFVLDKTNKERYKRVFPKYLKSLGIDIETKDRGPFNTNWISPTCFFDSSDYRRIHIGKNVVMSFDVCILVHDGSIMQAAYARDKRIQMHELILKDVYIGNNVFIGARTTILPGSIIGDNCIIGANSTVTGNKCKDPNNVYAGNPIRKICSIEDFFDKNSGLKHSVDKEARD